MPGGFTDSRTGIYIPGPVVHVDAARNRQVVRIESLRDPVQLPHKKMVLEYKTEGVPTEVEVDVNAHGFTPMCAGLDLALQTGIIRQVSDEDVEERHPEAWAKRSTHYVFMRDSSVIPMADLMDAY